MKLSRTVRLLLSLVSGVTLALAYPSFNIPLLGWIAPALLIVAVLGERPRFSFLLGWLQGAAYYGMSLPWFYTVMRQYGPLSVIQAGAVFALVIVATSLFHAAFAAAIAWLGEGAPERACLAAPFLWVTMEFAMMHLPAIGFPWDLLGYAAAGNLVFVQLTAITGIFGLSLLVASYSALAAWVFLQMSQRKQGGITIWIAANVLLIVIAGRGSSLYPPGSSRSSCAFGADEFSSVQRLSVELDAGARGGNGPAGNDQHRGGARKFPASSCGRRFPRRFPCRMEFSGARAAHRAWSGRRLLGWRDRLEAAGRTAGSARTTAPRCLGPDGALDFMYDKIHLVPFSEYVPWRNWLFFAEGLDRAHR